MKEGGRRQAKQAGGRQRRIRQNKTCALWEAVGDVELAGKRPVSADAGWSNAALRCFVFSTEITEIAKIRCQELPSSYSQVAELPSRPHPVSDAREVARCSPEGASLPRELIGVWARSSRQAAGGHI